MKFVVVILAVLALAHAEESEWKVKTADELKEIRQECLREYPLSDEAVDKIRHFELHDEGLVRQYLLCTDKKVGTFTEAHGFHADRIAKQFKIDLEESEVQAIVQDCIDKTDKTGAVDVWSFRFYNCVMATKVGEKAKPLIQQELKDLGKST